MIVCIVVCAGAGQEDVGGHRSRPQLRVVGPDPEHHLHCALRSVCAHPHHHSLRPPAQILSARDLSHDHTLRPGPSPETLGPMETDPRGLQIPFITNLR